MLGDWKIFKYPIMGVVASNKAGSGRELRQVWSAEICAGAPQSPQEVMDGLLQRKPEWEQNFPPFARFPWLHAIKVFFIGHLGTHAVEFNKLALPDQRLAILKYFASLKCPGYYTTATLTMAGQHTAQHRKSGSGCNGLGDISWTRATSVGNDVHTRLTSGLSALQHG